MRWNKIAYRGTIVVALIVIGMLVGMPAGAQAQIDDGLVGEWHFDGDAKDSSGNGNDGTIYGATFVVGKFGKALSFNGATDYVNVPENAGLNLNFITVEMWIKPTMDTSDDIGRNIIDKRLLWSNNEEYTMYVRGQGDIDVYLGTTGEHAFFDGTASVIPMNEWSHLAFTWDGNTLKVYRNGSIIGTVSGSGTIVSNSQSIKIGTRFDFTHFFKGIIDEVRIYNRALSAEEIKALYEQGSYEQGQTSISVKKEASPYSIRQYQTTTVTIQIKNTGTSEIRDIEVIDSTNSNLDLVSGEFPNPKKYNSLRAGESREIQYILKSKESGTFILDPVTVSYADDKANIKVVKSEPVSVSVIPSSEGAAESSSPSELASSAVLLHGEKTDVVLGEDILLKLSAVNLITKPPMTVQVILYPPSGMSVTGSEFVKSGAGIYTTTYTLNPGDGKDIEIHIKSNQVGDFGVKGRIVYYFGDDKKSVEDHTLNLPIKVRKEPGQTAASPPSSNDGVATPKAPGFAGGIAIIGVLFMAIYIRKRF